jgi:hypothetical protein
MFPSTPSGLLERHHLDGKTVSRATGYAHRAAGRLSEALPHG